MLYQKILQALSSLGMSTSRNGAQNAQLWFITAESFPNSFGSTRMKILWDGSSQKPVLPRMTEGASWCTALCVLASHNSATLQPWDPKCWAEKRYWIVLLHYQTGSDWYLIHGGELHCPLSLCFHLHLYSTPLQFSQFCFRSAWIELSKMLSIYLSSLLFQRAAEELFSPCVTTNGPFIMSSNSPSAGNIAWKQAQQFISAVRRPGFTFLVIILKSLHF